MSASTRKPDPPAPPELVRWMVIKTEWHGVHVLPTNDLYEHLRTGDCPCGVHCEGDAPDELRWVHDSFDGREAYETGERKTS